MDSSTLRASVCDSLLESWQPEKFTWVLIPKFLIRATSQKHNWMLKWQICQLLRRSSWCHITQWPHHGSRCYYLDGQGCRQTKLLLPIWHSRDTEITFRRTRQTLDPSVVKVKLLTTQHLSHKSKCINYLGSRIFKNLTFCHILKDN